MKIIVAVDENWGIGRDNGLLAHIPGDLKYFKETTLGKVVVMGRKTLESLPQAKPLPGRTNLVISSDKDYQPGCPVYHSLEELFQALEAYNSEDVYIVGGARVYEELFDCCDTYFVTKIQRAFPADRYFRNLDQCQELELVWEGPVQEYQGLTYQFTEYRRK
ncbi:dihydrofolate reductase [Aminipila butyrica]|uniref:Dihydrofolate reductase n=1 Tax=Aminipila butyrica TaxID=433296 RepID=A0A858BW06_9FIRM|nr:dihydrofolate reductase [Aminipila butyrica]QIB70251.1 dihydrofolate reductase [Aminipila butyrica]